MPKFIVERHLPGITVDKLQAAGVRAKTCCEEMSDEGTEVLWHRSFFLPDSEQTFCVFEAPSREVVAEANERAQIPFEKIHESMEMTPEGV